ncbi:unnamed protein product [Rhizopus stolonifer]
MWTSELKRQRLLYYNWVSDLLQSPIEEPPSVDHPLNDERGSKWASYFEDNLILEQIDKDVRRTLPDFAFFHSHVSINSLNPLSPRQKQKKENNDCIIDPLSVSIPEKHELRTGRFSFGLKGQSSLTSNKIISDPLGITESEDVLRPQRLTPRHRPDEPLVPFIPTRRSLFKRMKHGNSSPDVQDYHWEVIERILFIYAKLNPDVSYVQGMNELLAPIYYVFVKSDSIESQPHAEADAFFVFNNLMSDVRDHFVGFLDMNSSTGINATMARLSQRLAWFDEDLFQDLNRKDIKAQYYAFRWITVLCSQDWDLPDVIRLWDSILADRGMHEGRFEFLLDFTVAMLVCIRKELLMGDFSDNMHILQNYPIGDIQVVINCAYTIREARLKAEKTGSDTESSGFLSISPKLDEYNFLNKPMDEKCIGSIDRLFKKDLTTTATEISTRKRISTEGMTVQSLSQKLGFTGNTSTRSMRAASVRSSLGENEFKRNWSFASPLEEPESEVRRSGSLLGRFSQLILNDPLTHYRELEEKPSQIQYQVGHPANNKNGTARAYKGLSLS